MTHGQKRQFIVAFMDSQTTEEFFNQATSVVSLFLVPHTLVFQLVVHKIDSVSCSKSQVSCMLIALIAVNYILSRHPTTQALAKLLKLQ